MGRLDLLLGLSLAACHVGVGASPPDDCEGYPCTEFGFELMIRDVAQHQLPFSSKAELDELAQRLAAIGKDQMELTPKGFHDAQVSVQTILAAETRGPVPALTDADSIEQRLEALSSRGFSLCPLWPFC